MAYQSKLPFVEQRRVWKQQILDFIIEHGPADDTRVKGLFSLKTGLTYHRISQYLEELEDAGLIERDGDLWRPLKAE